MNGNGIKELKAWIEKNQNQLKDYSITDIVNLAIACGFDRSAVAAWATSQRFQNA